MESKFILFGMFSLLFFISACSQDGEDYIIDGNAVYINDSNVYLRAEPHTLFYSDWVEVEFESKIFSGEINFAFGFDTDQLKPKRVQIYNPYNITVNNSYTCEHEFEYTLNPNHARCYEINFDNQTGNERTLFERDFDTGNLTTQTVYWAVNDTIYWRDFEHAFNVIDYEFDGKNKWYYIQGQHINAGQTYKLRYYLEVPYGANNLKYDIALWPFSETIQEAIENNHFYYLDPWADFNLGIGNELYLTFDSGEELTDKTGNNHIITNINATWFNDPSLGINGAWNFTNGTHTTQMLNVSNLYLGNNYTIMAWHRPQDVAKSNYIFSMDNGTDNNQRGVQAFGWNTGNKGNYNFTWNNPGNVTGTNDPDIHTGHENTWLFLAFTYDSTDNISRIYVGNSTALYNWSSLENPGGTINTERIRNDSLCIGNKIIDLYQAPPWDVLQQPGGALGEFGAWNRSLDNSTIVGLYNNYVVLTYGPPTGELNISINITPTIATVTTGSLNCTSNITLTSGLNFNASLNWSNNSYSIVTNFSNLVNGSSISANITPPDSFIAGEIWNCSIWAYERDNISYADYNSDTLTISNTIPTWVENPNNETIYHSKNISLQYICSDPDPGDTLLYNITNITGNFEVPAVINGTTGLFFYDPTINDLGNFDFNITCGDGTANISQILNITILQNIYYNQSSNQNKTVEGGNIDFYLTVNLTNISTTPSDVRLLLNGTSLSSSQSSSQQIGISKIYQYLSQSTIPDGQGLTTGNIIPWNWTFTINDIVTNFTTNHSNITIYDMGVGNCTEYGTLILNYTVKDEENKTKTGLSGVNIEGAINIFSKEDHNINWNYSTNTTSNPFQVCVPNNSLNTTLTEFWLNAIVKYSAIEHVIEYNNIQNTTLKNGSLENINLYDLAEVDSTDFRLTFTGSDFLPVENALVVLARQYISENTFETVELPKTDSNGQTILHMVRNDIVYNIQIIKNGELLGNFENIIAFCADFTIGDCTIDLNALSGTQEIYDADADLGIIFTAPEYNSTTNKVTFDFITSDGSVKIMNMVVGRSDVFGNRTICNETLESSGGTLTCDIDPNIEDATISVSISVNGILAVFDLMTLDPTNYGEAGYLVFFVMAMSFILLFSSSKTGVLIGMVLAFAGGIGLGILSSSMIGAGASGLWLIIIIIIGIWRLNKDRPQ